MKSADNPLEDVPLPLVPRIPEMNQPLDVVYFHEQSRINWQFDGCVEPMAASTEIWKCNICDRMMFFDDPSAPVSRYMRCIDTESLDKDELAHEHKNGICFNNLLFNEVDWFVDSKHERSGEPDYEILGNPGEPDRDPLFTCRMMEERIFSHENGRFRNWWRADSYDDLIVFYSPFRDREKGAAPVKAWKRYSQVWWSEA